MDISLIKFLALLFFYIYSGSPNKVIHDYDLGLSFYLSENNVSGVYLNLNYDPVFVYEKDLSSRYCGMTFINVIQINPRSEQLGCKYTFEHEMAHVWQYREFGLLTPIIKPFAPSFEPEDGYKSIPWHSRKMNFPLIRISVPLIP